MTTIPRAISTGNKNSQYAKLFVRIPFPSPLCEWSIIWIQACLPVLPAIDPYTRCECPVYADWFNQQSGIMQRKQRCLRFAYCRKPSALHGWLNHPACSKIDCLVLMNFDASVNWSRQNKERMQSGTILPPCTFFKDMSLFPAVSPFFFGSRYYVFPVGFIT